MAATRQMIEHWFIRGFEDQSTHLIVVCDTFDHEDYPVFVSASENVHEKEKLYDGQSMQRVMEVYCLSGVMSDQLNQRRCRNYGPANSPPKEKQ